jgi:nucleoside-diphosphate-sugar epimerase
MNNLKDKCVLLLGCGDIGSQLGQALQAEDCPVLAVRRNVAALPTGIPALAMDYTDASQVQALASRTGSIVVMTPTPAAASAEGYRRGYLDAVTALLRIWKESPPLQILFVSSTRVYGDQGGAWVDENSALMPEGYAGESIAAAERLLLDSPHAVTLVRFAGIYGRHPSRLLQRVQAGGICARQPLRYSNRIHRADCFGFLLHLVQALRRGEQLQNIYLGVDDAPVSQWEVESWLAQRLRIEIGSESGGEQVDARRGVGKRCSNHRLRASGYQLQYPDYKCGYEALLSEALKGP